MLERRRLRRRASRRDLHFEAAYPSERPIGSNKTQFALCDFLIAPGTPDDAATIIYAQRAA